MPSSPAIRNSRRHADEDVTSFFLTDYLARHFDKLIWEGLGMDRHPELLPLYFGNYTKIVFLAQTRNEELAKKAWPPRRAWASPMSTASPAMANSSGT